MNSSEETCLQFSAALNDYYKAVIGIERSRHTYYRRLNTIEELSEGIKGKKVLDVGCGYGFRTVGLGKCGADSVLGIDVERARIREASKYAHETGVLNVQFAVMNAESTDFADNSFDVVVADEMIHHVDDPPAVIGEMHRITKNDGVTVISDHNKWSLPSQAMRYVYFGRERARLFSAKQIESLLKAANYRAIKYRHIIFTLPFRRVPHVVLKMNHLLEYLVERTPCLRLQCGVYVIRGRK